MKWFMAFLMIVVAFGVVVPAQAQTLDTRLNDSEEPGSFLVFHKFLRGGVNVNGFQEPKSAFEISVTCPKDVSGAPGLCTTGTSVRLALQWICPGQKFGDDTCRKVDFFLSTTVYGTLWFNPDNVGTLGETRFQTVPRPPGSANPNNATHCPEGFLVAYVVDSSGRAIKFDGLIGDAVLRHHPGSAGAYNALPIQAAPRTRATGSILQPTPGAPLVFDGTTHYMAITGKVWATVRLERLGGPRPVIETHLTLLTLDVLSGRQNFPTVVEFNMYNENEVPNSGSVEFVCWTQVRLTELGGFDEFFGRKGLFESTAAFVDDGSSFAPVTLIAIVSTIERSDTGAIAREYSYSTYHDSTPVPTTFDP